MREFSLDYAKQNPRTTGHIVRRALDLFSRDADEDEAVQDFVFLTFMSGRQKTNLALRLPHRIRRFLDRRRGRAGSMARRPAAESATPSLLPRVVGAILGLILGTGLGQLTNVLLPIQGSSALLVLSGSAGGALVGLIAGAQWRDRLPWAVGWGIVGGAIGLTDSPFLAESNRILLFAMGLAIAGALAETQWWKRFVDIGAGLIAGSLIASLATGSIELATYEAVAGALTGAVVSMDLGRRLKGALAGLVIGLALWPLSADDVSKAARVLLGLNLNSMVIMTAALSGAIGGLSRRSAVFAALSGSTVLLCIWFQPFDYSDFLLNENSAESFLVAVFAALPIATILGSLLGLEPKSAHPLVARSRSRVAPAFVGLEIGASVSVVVLFILTTLDPSVGSADFLFFLLFAGISSGLAGAVMGERWPTHLMPTLLGGLTGILSGWGLVRYFENDDPFYGGLIVATGFSLSAAIAGRRRAQWISSACWAVILSSVWYSIGDSADDRLYGLLVGLSAGAVLGALTRSGWKWRVIAPALGALATAATSASLEYLFLPNEFDLSFHAVVSGFSGALTGSLVGPNRRNVRWILLACLAALVGWFTNLSSGPFAGDAVKDLFLYMSAAMILTALLRRWFWTPPDPQSEVVGEALGMHPAR